MNISREELIAIRQNLQNQIDRIDQILDTPQVTASATEPPDPPKKIPPYIDSNTETEPPSTAEFHAPNTPNHQPIKKWGCILTAILLTLVFILLFWFLPYWLY